MNKDLISTEIKSINSKKAARKILHEIVDEACDKSNQSENDDFWFNSIISIMSGIYTLELALFSKSKGKYQMSADRLTNRIQSIQ